MKTLRMFAVALFFAAIFAVSSYAQAGGAAGAGKIAVIDTGAFGDPAAGIKTYVSAMKTLETEFKPVQDDLNATQTKLQTLVKDIQNLQKPGVPVAPATLQAKQDEGEKLEIEFKRKQEDAKVRFGKRQQALMTPVMQNIYKAVQEFSKKNGYVMVLDVAKMADDGSLLALDDSANVTKAFIEFYNARPAGSATTVAPK